MENIEEYKIVSETTIWQLEDRVNEAIKNGFVPHGSMLVGSNFSGEKLYMQPVIKTLEEKEWDNY